jgi:hypothetical protein
MTQWSGSSLASLRSSGNDQDNGICIPSSVVATPFHLSYRKSPLFQPLTAPPAATSGPHPPVSPILRRRIPAATCLTPTQYNLLRRKTHDPGPPSRFSRHLPEPICDEIGQKNADMKVSILQDLWQVSCAQRVVGFQERSSIVLLLNVVISGHSLAGFMRIRGDFERIRKQ